MSTPKKGAAEPILVSEKPTSSTVVQFTPPAVEGKVTAEHELKAIADGYKLFCDHRAAIVIDPNKRPSKPEPILSLLGQTVLTVGNISNVASQAKAMKSAFVGAAVAGIIGATVAPQSGGDFLGWECAPNHKGHAVIVIDTEQPAYQVHTAVDRCLRRAGVQSLPEWVIVVSLLGWESAETTSLLIGVLEHAKITFGGTLLTVIDGGADFVSSPNDDKESKALIDTLHRLAKVYSTAFLNVIHENPGAVETGKTRGHLGSMLERKSESNLRVEVEIQNETTKVMTVHSERGMRHGHIAKKDGIKFRWDDDAGMPVTLPDSERASKPGKKEKFSAHSIVEMMQEKNVEMRHGEALEAMIQRGWARGTFNNRWADLIAEKRIQASKLDGSLWSPAIRI